MSKDKVTQNTPAEDILIEEIKFDDFDKLGLKPFGERLFEIIDDRHNLSSHDKGFAVSLNAPFGNGKTTFLHMFKNFVKEKENYEVLFIDAWRTDFCERPILAIISQLLKEIPKFKDNKKIIKSIGLIGLSMLNQGVRKYTGIDAKEALKNRDEWIEKNRDEWIERLGTSVVKGFQEEENAIKNLRLEINKFFKNKKLLIIVDELDRTRPDYAVRFLEDIKHFFDIENISFLFGINKDQMEKTVKQLYGDLDFNGYYRKFFKIELDMPDVYKQIESFVFNLKSRHKIELYEKDSVTNKNGRQTTQGVRSLSLICKIFKLRLREIECLLSNFQLILNNKKRKNREIFWYFRDMYMLFLCIKIKYSNSFNEIISGNYDLEKISEFLNKNLNIKNDVDFLDIYTLSLSCFLEDIHSQQSWEKIKSDPFIESHQYDIEYTKGNALQAWLISCVLREIYINIFVMIFIK